MPRSVCSAVGDRMQNLRIAYYNSCANNAWVKWLSRVSTFSLAAIPERISDSLQLTQPEWPKAPPDYPEAMEPINYSVDRAIFKLGGPGHHVRYRSCARQVGAWLEDYPEDIIFDAEENRWKNAKK